ncbi:MAG: hypothetical protein ACOYOP_05150 [Microthrixaceae bacterium]
MRAGIFSLTPPAPADDDGSYLRWHLLDHMPEQYGIPGVVLAHRWTAEPDLLAERIVDDAPLGDTANLVQYYVTDPVEPTFAEFMQLGRRLDRLGRFPERRPSLGLRMLAHLRWYAAPSALVSPEVIAFRPHRGILFVVEEPGAEEPGDGVDAWLRWLHREHLPALLDVEGIAGAALYRSNDLWRLPDRIDGDDAVVTVVYLDGDPVATTRRAAGLLGERWSSGAVRPLFAGPLRSMAHWEVWP